MTTQASKKITQARTSLVLDHPFFGALALKIHMLEDPTCKDMWVDGTTMGYNPEYINSITMTECKTLVAKLVMHCALCHHVRRGHRDKKKWNVAATKAVTPILIDSDFKLPEGLDHDTTYQNKSAEEIYHILPEDQNGDNGNGSGSGDGNGTGNGNGNGTGDGNGDENKDGSGNNDQPPGEVRDNKDVQSEAQRNEQENEWKIAATQAAKAAKMAGKLPGSIKDLIEELNEPKVDWREQLQNYMGSFAKDDYTWMRPNRRYIGEDIYLPSLHSETLGEIVIAIDTSGSISKEELIQFSSELNSILENSQPSKVTVIYCDTDIAHTEEFTPDDFPVKLNKHGGGGTRFSPVFKYVNDHLQETPECLVYLTDMYCDDFGPEPPYPTLWVSTSDHTKAPWGTVIKLDIPYTD